MPKRVGIIALQHEANTFLPRLTDLEAFRRHVFATGRRVIERFEGGHHEVTGFLEGVKANGIETVPLLVAATMPGGTITAAAYRYLLEFILSELRAAGPLDGLLVAPHGAAVSEQIEDVDGDWLMNVRELVGTTIPIIGTIDPHANLSAKMVRACDALIPYRTNPHVDQQLVGREAAELMARTLAGDVKPTMAAAFPAVAINIASQNTNAEPLKSFKAFAADLAKQPGVLTADIVLGFPYADVAEMGSSVICVTDNNPALAQQTADRLAAYLVEHREQFDPKLMDVAEAVELAAKSESPVCLLDMGDNVGGGSPGDGTLIAHELHRKKLGRALVVLCDSAVVAAARQAGVGHELHLQVGGKTDDLHGPPIVGAMRVVRLTDGRFTEGEVKHGGWSQFDMGPTAVLEWNDLTLIVHSHRTPPFSLGQVTSCGVDPSSFRAIVAKGVNAPIAAYTPVCKTFVHVNTPGLTTASMTRLPFRRRRVPLFPFEK